MERDVNEVRLKGRLGSSLKINPARTAAMVSIATKEEWGDQNKKEKTSWHTLQFYGAKKVAAAADALSKGSRAYITGKLQNEKWTGANGQDNFMTKVVVDTFEPLDKKKTTPTNN